MTRAFCNRCEREITGYEEKGRIRIGAGPEGQPYVFQGHLCDLCQDSLKAWLKPEDLPASTIEPETALSAEIRRLNEARVRREQ